MKRHRSSEEASVIRLVDMLARERSLKINESGDRVTILSTLVDAISHAPQNDILVHGTRVESMFSYVAGALGHCEAVKQEDAGELYCAKPDIAVPDFRVLTLEGEEFFVEVKNCHEASTKYRYRMTREYLTKLCNYADVFGRKLKIAIYWSRHSLWSLVSPDAFELDGRYCSLSMEQCMKRSQMEILGDSMVGTVPPITLKVIPDPRQPRNVGSNGKTEFVIGETRLTCGGREVKGKFERKLAWFLLLYGDWDPRDPEVEIEDGNLAWIRFEATKDFAKGQQFAMLGFLSHMVSLQFNELTAEEGEVVRLSPSTDPDNLGILIPADFRGDDVRLWRFVMSPNYE